MPVLSAARLTSFSEDLFTAGGVRREVSRVVAQSLVEANLRGHDSHGVMRIPSYLDRVREGKILPEATLSIIRETPAVIIGDGGWGFGQIIARDLVQRLIEKARNVGIACGTLKQTAHIGRLGEWAEIATEQGLGAWICANTHGAGQRVSPVGGIRPRIGTNPLCIGLPGGKEGPFLLDFGTSATAEGKVRVKKISGQPVPDGWLLDSEGNPTNDPNTLYGTPPGTILPMGGDQAYKGFGLAYMIEILCGGFSGGACAIPNPPPPLGNCAMFTVFDPNLFAGADHLLDEVSRLEDYVRTVPRKEGVNEITLPGDPERKTLRKRTAEGIPLDDLNWKALTDLAKSLNVSTPN